MTWDADILPLVLRRRDRRIVVTAAVAIFGAALFALTTRPAVGQAQLDGTIVHDLGTRLELSGLDGSNRRWLVRTPAGERAVPAWSPDGSQIAIARGGTVLVAGVVDGRLTRLFGRPGYIGQLRWAPDGTRIAFDWLAPSGRWCARNDPADRGMFVVDVSDGAVTKVKGAERARLGRGVTRHFEVIGWDPAGRRLLYGDWRWPKGGDCGRTVELVDSVLYHVGVAGGAPTRMPRAGAGQAEWSPDGSKIAFFWSDCAPLVAKPNGRSRQQLLGAGSSTNSCFFEGRELAWSPDAVELYVAVDERVVAVRPRDGRRRTLMRDPGLGCVEDFVCVSSFRALSRDGQRLVVDAEGGTRDAHQLIVLDTERGTRRAYVAPETYYFAVFMP